MEDISPSVTLAAAVPRCVIGKILISPPLALSVAALQSVLCKVSVHPRHFHIFGILPQNQVPHDLTGFTPSQNPLHGDPQMT